MINVHASLLPSYRGAAPVHRAVIAGDAETGVTIMRVVKALDAGPMLATATRPIGAGRDQRRGRARPGRARRRAAASTSSTQLAAGPRDEDAAGRRARHLRAEADEGRRARSTGRCRRARFTTWFAACSRGRTRTRTLDGQRADPASHRTARPAQRPTAAAPGTIVEAGGDRLVVAAGDGRSLQHPRAAARRAAGDARARIPGRPAGSRPGARFAPP